MINPLGEPAQRFIDDVGRGLIARDDVDRRGVQPGLRLRRRDGLHTDDELWALIATFGPLLDTPLARATPDDVRKAGPRRRQARSCSTQPSELFDAARAGRPRRHRARAYYRRRARDRVRRRRHRPAHLRGRAGRDRSASSACLLGARLEGRRTSRRPAAPPAIRRCAGRDRQHRKPRRPTRPLDELLAELDELVGLDDREARSASHGQPHPGRAAPARTSSCRCSTTAATSCSPATPARARRPSPACSPSIYRSLGVVPKGHSSRPTARSSSPATSGRPRSRCARCSTKPTAGVLLIDEAYALARGGDRRLRQGGDRHDRQARRGPSRLDHRHRGRLPRRDGRLRRRQPRAAVAVPEDDPLPRLLHRRARRDLRDARHEQQLHVSSPTTTRKVRAWFDAQPRIKGFGNGRLARNLFEAAVARQAEPARRQSTRPTDEQLCTFADGRHPRRPQSAS